MAIFVRLVKNKFKSRSNYGKWNARIVTVGETSTAQIAAQISQNTTFKQSEVIGIIKELASVMRQEMQQGRIVQLDEIGRFHLSIESDNLDNPDEFNSGRNIVRVKTKFMPAGNRVGGKNGFIEQTFAQGTKVCQYRAGQNMLP